MLLMISPETGQALMFLICYGEYEKRKGQSNIPRMACARFTFSIACMTADTCKR